MLQEKFERIEVDLSENEIYNIIRSYVKCHLRPESQETFKEAFDSKPIEEALTQAIINEFVIEALQNTINEENTIG